MPPRMALECKMFCIFAQYFVSRLSLNCSSSRAFIRINMVFEPVFGVLVTRLIWYLTSTCNVNQRAMGGIHNSSSVDETPVFRKNRSTY